MASRFVVCKDKEEVLAILDAGLLWINWGVDSRDDLALAEEHHRWLVERYVNETDGGVWEARDFMYLVEDDSRTTED